MWRTFSIRPWYEGKPKGFARPFYAPTFNTAMALARMDWPNAESWECLGSVEGRP